MHLNVVCCVITAVRMLCNHRHFWDIVASLSQDQQQKLLLFVTGSDRVPVGGVSEMKFKICKVPFQSAGKNDM